MLTVTVVGGIGPYSYTSAEPKLCLANTSQTALSASVSPETTRSYQVEVTDSRGQKQAASVQVKIFVTMLAVTLTASPASIKSGVTMLTVTVVGGIGPYSYTSAEPKLCLANTSQTALSASVSPETTRSYQVEVTDSRGQEQAASVQVHVVVIDSLAAEGPLAQALTEIWEMARKAKHKSLEKLVIRFYEAPATWQVHQALATMTKEAQVACRFDVGIEAEGVEKFHVDFVGRFDKANSIKSFLDPQVRNASECNFEAAYTLAFPSGLSLAPDRTEAFTKNLTRYGSGEAYVEAHAAAQEVPV